MGGRTLIFVPTYNERGNIELLYARIKKLALDADILFLDDNSPDGTGQIADGIAATDTRVQVIHRAGKLGVGGAHLAGIHWAYDRGYETLVTMDCDFTHQPEDIPVFIDRAEGHDVVTGTRFTDPRSLKDWDPFRKAVTFTGHFLTRHLLKMPEDVSGAFRLYRLDRIPRELFDRVTAIGYAFFFQSLFILSRNGFKIKEVPIVLPARTCGHSKMTVKEAATGFLLLLWTYFDAKLRRQKYMLPQRAPSQERQAVLMKGPQSL